MLLLSPFDASLRDLADAVAHRDAVRRAIGPFRPFAPDSAFSRQRPPVIVLVPKSRLFEPLAPHHVHLLRFPAPRLPITSFPITGTLLVQNGLGAHLPALLHAIPASGPLGPLRGIR